MATTRARSAQSRLRSEQLVSAVVSKPERTRATLLASLQGDLALATGFPAEAWADTKACNSAFGLPAWFSATAPLIYAHLPTGDASRWLLAVYGSVPLHHPSDSCYRSLCSFRVDRLSLMQRMFRQHQAESRAVPLIEHSIRLLDQLRSLIIPLDTVPVSDIEVSLVGNAAYVLIEDALDAQADVTARVARAAYAMAGGLFNIKASDELELTVAALAAVDGELAAWQSEANGLVTVLQS